ncbi:MAG: TRAP transporter small permease subunit [Azospirillum sp.]|nr:TRAP transporter small permease subunit [Azospirillum sp.]
MSPATPADAVPGSATTPAPPSVLRPLHAVLSRLSTLALWAAGSALVIMTLAVSWQVIGRRILNDTPAWAEPLSILLVSWMAFLGAAAGVRERHHIGFEVIRNWMPGPIQLVFDTLSMLAVAGFGGAMAWHGGWLALGTWSATLPTLGLPGGVTYLTLVVGGALICLFALERLALTWLNAMGGR